MDDLDSFTVGPAVKGVDSSIDQILWILLKVAGKPFRVGTLFLGSIDFSRQAVAAIEKKWNGRFLGYLIEPSYDHNGYYDPAGFAGTEQEYEAHQLAHGQKIGKLPHFITCPKCGNGHTSATVHCRNCGYTCSG